MTTRELRTEEKSLREDQRREVIIGFKPGFLLHGLRSLLPFRLLRFEDNRFPELLRAKSGFWISHLSSWRLLRLPLVLPCQLHALKIKGVCLDLTFCLR